MATRDGSKDGSQKDGSQTFKKVWHGDTNSTAKQRRNTVSDISRTFFLTFLWPKQFHLCFLKNVWEELGLFKNLKKQDPVFKQQNHAEILSPCKI